MFGVFKNPRSMICKTLVSSVKVRLLKRFLEFVFVKTRSFHSHRYGKVLYD